MKKIILTALVAVASLNASAQLYLGGALGFRTSKANSEAKAQNVFTLAPEIGYDINDKWTVGADINMAFGNNKVGENIGFDVYGRYNFVKTGIATFFVELAAGYSSEKFDSEIGSIENMGAQMSTAAAAGVGAYAGFAAAAADLAAALEGATKADAEATETEAKAAKSFNVSLRPGVKIALSDKVSLVAKLGLLGYKKYTDKGPSEFNVGVNNDAIKLGVYYSF